MTLIGETSATDCSKKTLIGETSATDCSKKTLIGETSTADCSKKALIGETSAIWTDAAVRCLLHLWSNNQDKFASLKTKTKSAWQNITTDLNIQGHSFTTVQVKSK
jgi:hypothetical protein